MSSIVPVSATRSEAPPMRGSLLFAPARDEELAAHAILRGVSRSAVEDGLLACPVLELDPGATLIRRGDVRCELYLVLTGELRIAVGEAVLATVPAGQTVGELCILDPRPATADVFAVVSARLLVLDEQAFWRLVHASHQVAVNMLHLLASRMRVSNEQVGAVLEQRRQAEQLSRTDPLTGLCNRRGLQEWMDRVGARSQRDSAAVSVLAIDVDHFKRINDTHGHAAGDRVLVGLAELLRAIVRPTDTVARVGGEEFLIALPETSCGGATIVAERVRVAARTLRVEMPDGSLLPPITVSVGVATLRKEETAAVLLNRADERLYDAKRAGRNRVMG